MADTTAVFPALPGLAWPVLKRPVTKTVVQQSASGRELRASSWGTPLLEWGLTFDVLRTKIVLATAYTEYEQLAGFFNARAGRNDSFLFEDLSDRATSASVFGTGDGVTRTFTLARALYLGIFPVGAATPTQVTIAGVPTSAYTLDGSQITFTTAPPDCAELAWSGTYLWRVRFRDDAVDFENFLVNLWAGRAVWLRQVK